jgi:RNA polymerase sigma-70 factor (ECF subfamily)
VDGSSRPAEAPPPISLEFQTLYRTEFHYVFHTLRRLGVRERELEDLTHDVMLTVHRRLAEYDRARPLRPWLWGIAYRVASDHRKLSRHRHEVTGVSVEPPDPAKGAHERIEEHQARELVLQALDTIDLEKRAVLIMHDLDGHGMPEIADALQVPLNTGYSRLRLARRDFEAAIRRIDPSAGGLP